MEDLDYYLEICPSCKAYNEFLDEVCPNCGQQLHIYPLRDLSDLVDMT